ncbi:MAG: isocitrate/isopropylmalate family dehydrogenase [bacterium]
MSSARIAVIAGDGIGPDLITQVEKVTNTLNRKYNSGIKFSQFPYCADYYIKSGISIPDEFIDEVGHNFDAILLGPLGDPRIADMKHAREIIYKLRNRLSLTMSIHPVRLFQSWLTTQKDIESKTVDYLIIKEIFESTIASSEHIFNKDKESALILQSNVFTNKNIRNFFQNAFDYIHKMNRTNACFVDQGLKYRHSQLLWNSAISELREKYPDITISNKYINAAIKDLLINPDEYDVFLSTAENGDVLSAVSSVTMGGYGLSYSIEINPELISVYRIMQASSPKLAGSNTINPFGAFLALQQILVDQGLSQEGNSIAAALMSNFSNHWVTIDMGGIMGTAEVTDYICDHIKMN